MMMEEGGREGGRDLASTKQLEDHPSIPDQGKVLYLSQGQGLILNAADICIDPHRLVEYDAIFHLCFKTDPRSFAYMIST